MKKQIFILSLLFCGIVCAWGQESSPYLSSNGFGTYVAKNVAFYPLVNNKADNTKPALGTVNLFVVTTGNKIMAKAVLDGSPEFHGNPYSMQFRIWNDEQTGFGEYWAQLRSADKKTVTIDPGSNYSNLNQGTRTTLPINTYMETTAETGAVPMFEYQLDYINNPIQGDETAPVISSATCAADPTTNNPIITLEATDANDMFYIFEDPAQNKTYSFEPTLTIQSDGTGTTKTYKCYAVDFNGNMSDATNVNVVMYVPLSNVALNKPATAGINQANAYQSNNGNWGDRWNSSGAIHYDPVTHPDDYQDWWYVDFGVVEDIETVVIKWENARPENYTFRTSYDGVNWTIINTYTTYPDPETLVTYSDIPSDAQGRYFGIWATSGYAGLAYGMSPYEVEVYGAPGVDTEAPTDLAVTATGVGSDAIDLHLTAKDNFCGLLTYIIVMDGDNDHAIIVEGNSGAETIKSFTGLTAGTHTFSVTVKDAANNASSAVETSGTTVSDTEAPTNLTIVEKSKTYNTITLTLSAEDNTHGIITYVVTCGATEKQVSAASGTSVDVTFDNLTYNTAYTFSVVAKDASQNATEPREKEITTTMPPFPVVAAPTPDVTGKETRGVYSDVVPVILAHGFMFNPWGGATANYGVAQGDNYMLFNTATNNGATIGVNNDGNDALIAADGYSDPDDDTHKGVYAVGMSYLHLDVWAESLSSNFKVLLNDHALANQTITGEGWQSIDIDITNEAAADLNNIRWMKFNDMPSGCQVAIDNVYFWKYAKVDDEKPVMVSASLVSATSSSATIAVVATDNNQVVKYIVKESGGKTSELTPSNGQIQLIGLTAQTSYSVSVQAVDKAGNISDNSIAVEFTTAEGPKPSGQFFGTAQMQNVPIYQSQDNKPKDNNVMSSIDYYIVTVGDLLLGKATIHDGNTFWPDADAINFRTWNEQKSAFETNLAKAGNDSQNPTKKWMQIGAGDQHGLSEYGDMVPMTVFVKSWITPAGGGERVATHTTDFFDYHRGYINNPTTDATAPALDLSKVEVTDDEQGGKITFTISADAVTADDEYFFYVVDEAHELFAISLENTISIARPNETNGQTYTFRCYAVDFNGNMSESYKEYAITMPFNENTNLALNKANVSCGDVQEPHVASYANDGNDATYWTCYGTPDLANAWWSVDLEAIYELNKLVVTWNDYSDDYTIYGSLDGSKWYAICNGAAAEQGQTINHDITNAAARYLKVVSNQKKDVGIKEFEAYASSLAADDHQNPEVAVSEVSKEYGSATLQIIATDKDDDEIEHPVRTIIISDVDNQLAPAEYTLDADNQVTLSDLHFNTTYNFKVEVIDRVGNSTIKTLQVVLPFNPEVNLALNKPSFAGAVQDDAHTADKGNDGNIETFWSGFTGEDLTKDWWYVDLGVAYNVNKVIIKWMNDYAKRFVIQGAMTKAQVDNNQWTDVYEYTYETEVANTIQTHVFTEAAAMRYLRIQSKENSHINGYEFYELQVYGTGFAADDTEAPEITLTDVLSTTHTTATLHLTAEDNVDGDLYDFYISETSKGLEETKYTADENGQVVLTGLNSVLGEYNLTIRVRDAIGHWTSTTLPVQLGYSEPWKNMALNKTATAGSVETGNEPSMANDESMSTKWGNYGKVTENDSWWQVDMLYSYNIASFVILWEHYPEAGGIKIEASNDDQTWTQLFASEQSYSANAMQEIILTESTTNQYRYVRISAPGNQYMSMYDFRVYASGMSAVIDEQSDNSAVIEAADGLTNNTVTLNRAFDVDGFNYTLCLPFDLSENQMQEAFGADYKLWKLDNAYMKSAEVLYLDFKEVRNLEAGVPYIFLPTQTFNAGGIFSGVTVKNELYPVTIDVPSFGSVSMTGIYSPYELPKENNYVLGSDNWLYKSAGDTMYGLRCYFTFGSSATVGVRARAVFHNTDVVTDLETVDGSQCTMRDGKYVINGQFVIIRNNVRYNGIGQQVK